MTWLDAWRAIVTPNWRKSGPLPESDRDTRRVTPCDTHEAALRKQARSGR